MIPVQHFRGSYAALGSWLLPLTSVLLPLLVAVTQSGFAGIMAYVLFAGVVVLVALTLVPVYLIGGFVGGLLIQLVAPLIYKGARSAIRAGLVALMAAIIFGPLWMFAPVPWQGADWARWLGAVITVASFALRAVRSTSRTGGLGAV